jgi:putative ATP-dependent endonuclease of the OLD family
MHLASVRIQNFRAYSDESVYFNDYTCIVGPNGGGKSTVLMALNVFFRETSHSKTSLTQLDVEDFHHRNTNEPITITVTFNKLNAEAQDEFREYYRHGKLIISARAPWNEEEKCAHVTQCGMRMGMDDFKPFFKAEGDGASVTELKKVYATIRDVHAELPPPGTKQGMIDALRAYEAARPADCVEIPSEDQFYGFSTGVNRLAKYVQWVFVPAVKDASDEELEAKDTALGILLARTVRMTVAFKDDLDALREETGERYQQVLDGQQAALQDLSDSLTGRLGHWAHPDTSVKLAWQNDRLTSIKIAEPLAGIIAGEGAFVGKLTRFGHGLQRSFLLALLEQLSRGSAEGPKLILGCEEPELYQHPPQARHLASVFQTLATKNSQVIVCTHSPYFVSGRGFEDVRSIRPDFALKTCRCNQATLDQIAKSLAEARGEVPKKATGTALKVEQALQPALSEIFFTNVLVLVEGIEDVAYITTYLTLTERWDDFRKLGCHLVPAGGKSSIPQPLAIARHLKIPTFVVFDSDGHSVPGAQEQDKNGRRAMHEKDNITILKLAVAKDVEPFPIQTMWDDRTVMWNTENAF